MKSSPTASKVIVLMLAAALTIAGFTATAFPSPARAADETVSTPVSIAATLRVEASEGVQIKPRAVLSTGLSVELEPALVGSISPESPIWLEVQGAGITKANAASMLLEGTARVMRVTTRARGLTTVPADGMIDVTVIPVYDSRIAGSSAPNATALANYEKQYAEVANGWNAASGGKLKVNISTKSGGCWWRWGTPTWSLSTGRRSGRSGARLYRTDR